jgi:hypothetical protein
MRWLAGACANMVSPHRAAPPPRRHCMKCRPNRGASGGCRCHDGFLGAGGPPPRPRRTGAGAIRMPRPSGAPWGVPPKDGGARSGRLRASGHPSVPLATMAGSSALCRIRVTEQVRDHRDCRRRQSTALTCGNVQNVTAARSSISSYWILDPPPWGASASLPEPRALRGFRIRCQYEQSY